MQKKKLIIEDFEEVLDRDVKKFSHTGHVIVGKKHVGKKAVVIVGKKAMKTTGHSHS